MKHKLFTSIPLCSCIHRLASLEPHFHVVLFMSVATGSELGTTIDNTPCGVHPTCFSCTSNSQCGWCATNNHCLMGNSSSPKFKTCTSWFYSTCPAGSYPEQRTIQLESNNSSLTMRLLPQYDPTLSFYMNNPPTNANVYPLLFL